MKNLNSKEVLNEVASHLPENIETMLVIATDDSQHVRTLLFGCDQMGMSLNAVALAAAMHDLLDGQLGIADSIYQRFADEGKLEVHTQSAYHKCVKPKCECEKKSCEEDKHSEQPNPADLLHKMIDTIFCDFVGGDNDEDDN